MNNINSNHFTYTHWLKIDTYHELGKWQQLKEYKEKYDCSMTVFYYDYNPLMDKVIKLDCNQSYQDLDLDVNSSFDTSLKRLTQKPTNVTAYNKGINEFFKQKLGVEIQEKSLFPDLNEKDFITVDVLKEFPKLKNIEEFAELLEKEQWRVIKIKSERSYHYQLYFGKGKQVANRYEFAFHQFMYKSRMADRLQMFINNVLKHYEFNIDKFIGHKINAFEPVYNFSTGEKMASNVKCVGLVLGINDNKIDIYNGYNPIGSQHYTIDYNNFKKFVEDGLYKQNYNLLSNYEKMELRKYMYDKLEKFGELCGDWDYRNIDMTEPHLESIEIKGNNISIYCEKFSTDLDDYVSCSAGVINDKKLVKQFNVLDLSNYEKVLDFMREIEHHIDFKEVEKNLELEEQNELDSLEKEEELDKEMEMDI